MSTLFLVGGVDKGQVREIIEAKFPHLFHRVVTLDNVDELLLYLYRERIGTEDSRNSDASRSPWSFETGIALIVHGESYSRDLNSTLRKFFPCLNALAVEESRIHEESSSLTPSENIALICRDRIARMAHWMYKDESVDGIYVMIRHLRIALQLDRQVAVIPRALKNINYTLLLGVKPETELKLWESLNTWAFQPHSLQTAELVYCGFILLRHCARACNLSINENKLLLMLFTLEASYHQVNSFHNFRHAVDVMQAAWQLARKLLKNPLQILLIALAALGHDVGHPGANNHLLGKYNSPIALHYNQKSLLENLHADIFTSLLLEHWPQLVDRDLGGAQRLEIISDAIMATDMAFHGDYVRQLQELNRVDSDARSLSPLILKAADISNVTRPLVISAQWATLITLEFDDCSLLDRYQAAGGEHNCSTNLTECKNFFKGDKTLPLLECRIENSQNFYRSLPEQLIKRFPTIPAGQIFFIDTFAEQFFAEFCKKFPELSFLVENVRSNREFWVSRL